MIDLDLIARGRTAEVYAWEPGKVLKLFQPWASRGMVEYEQYLAYTVYAAGVRTPAVYEIVEKEGRLGLVYERVNSISMLGVMRQRPWLTSRLARQFAELQVAMNACKAPALRPMRERLTEKIRGARPLPEELKEAALAALEKLPEDDRICHGDFHPDNILMTEQGPMVIDWIDATAGHPLGDVARTALLVRYGKIPPGTPMAWLIELLRSTFYRVYLKRYRELSPFQESDLSPWLGVIAAGRLDEGIVEEENHWVEMVRKIFLPSSPAASDVDQGDKSKP